MFCPLTLLFFSVGHFPFEHGRFHSGKDGLPARPVAPGQAGSGASEGLTRHVPSRSGAAAWACRRLGAAASHVAVCQSHVAAWSHRPAVMSPCAPCDSRVVTCRVLCVCCDSQAGRRPRPQHLNLLCTAGAGPWPARGGPRPARRGPWPTMGGPGLRVGGPGLPWGALARARGAQRHRRLQCSR